MLRSYSLVLTPTVCKAQAEDGSRIIAVVRSHHVPHGGWAEFLVGHEAAQEFVDLDSGQTHEGDPLEKEWVIWNVPGVVLEPNPSFSAGFVSVLAPTQGVLTMRKG